MKHVSALLLTSVCLVAGGAVHASDAARMQVTLDIDPQPVRAALKAFSDQTGVQVLLRVDNVSVDAVLAPNVEGQLTLEAALERLLSGSGLQYEFINDRTVRVSAPASEATSQNMDDAARSQQRVEENEVVVTGTRVRGVEPVVPVQVFTRDDFDKAGATTAQEFLALLPQNFGGGFSSDTTESALPDISSDLGYGSAVNLRGVGGTSTLVLVDGRRIAAAGVSGYSDVSMVPLAAVERIEVMTDGAAALYGSDAIGGVVNFILRKDFSGAETRLRYGDTTEGGLAQRQASQLFGVNWNGGNAVLAYEYVDQDDLDRLDRDFSANMPGTNNGPRPLIPAHESHNVALFAKQRIGDRVQLSGNGTYAQRNGTSFSWDSAELLIMDIDVERKQYGAGVGVTIDLGRSWQAQVSGNADKSSMRRGLASSIERYTYDSVADLQSATVQLTGDLLRLPWGAVKLAMGGEYREESLTFNQYLNGVPRGVPVNKLIDTKAAFGELSIPFGSRGERTRAPIEVSLAGRYEEHGDIGHTFDPKYGVRWTPLQALSFYASYGTSFKVPTLDQLSQNRNVSSITRVTDATTGATVPVLTQLGNNMDLREESAKILSAGMEFSVPVLDGLQGRLGYFDIDYFDRIAKVTATVPTILAQPAYDSLLTRRGDVSDAQFDALLAELLSGANARVLGCAVPLDPATGACPMSVAPIQAIIDRRLQNFSGVQVQGLDLTLAQSIGIGASSLRLSFDASYMLSFDQKLDPESAELSILSTLYHPVDFRFRASASWDHADWTLALAVNHTDDYSTRNSAFQSDDSPMPLVGIDAWTTLDLAFSYRLANKFGGWLENTDVGLNVANVLDEDPPFVDDQYRGLGYDPANADPRGRFVSLTITKGW